MGDIAGALAVVNDFDTNDTGPIAWQLDRAATLLRLRALIGNPNLVHQHALNACGPAVFFRIWLARDPVAAARFACALLRHGSAQIGSLIVTAGWKLLGQNYGLLRAATDAAQADSTPEPADWMLLSALRDSENILFDYLGEPNTIGDRAAGVTLPGTLAGWLSATGLYSGIADQTSILLPTDPKSLFSLIPTSNMDVVIFLNHNAVAPLIGPIPTGPAPAASFLSVPDHYVLMTGPFGQWTDPSWTKIDCWTWGSIHAGWQGTALFSSNYFGELVATA